MDKKKIYVHVCVRGDTCPCCGSLQLLADLKQAVIAQNWQDQVEIHEEGCLSLCSTAPNVVITPFGEQHGPASAAQIIEAIKTKLKINP